MPQTTAAPGQVLEELADIALGRKCYPAYGKNGEELWEKPAMTARLKALELLGKHYELFGKSEARPDAAVEVEVRVEGGGEPLQAVEML